MLQSSTLRADPQGTSGLTKLLNRGSNGVEKKSNGGSRRERERERERESARVRARASERERERAREREEEGRDK